MYGAILTVKDKKNGKLLKRKTETFDFQNFTKKEVVQLIVHMRKLMRAARGVGLSANQIGHTYRMFIAEVPDPKGATKFYAVFNPRIEKLIGEKLLLEEGCLSVPGIYGKVERSEKMILSGFDKNGRKIKIKSWGLLAHVFQHEVDHLNGILFTDKAKELYERPLTDRLQTREEEREEQSQ